MSDFVTQKQIENDLKRQIARVFKDLNTLPKEYRGKARKSLLRKPALMVRDAARSKAPQSKRPHYRYRKTAGGSTEKITYLPGNLKKSIRVLTFPRSADVFVGPKKKPKNKESSVYGADRQTVDPYYAGWVEFGGGNNQPVGYMRKAYDTTKSQVIPVMEKNVEKIIKRWQKRISAKNASI